MAVKNRLSIIQGPPGTGKTTVVGAIASQWIKQKDQRILICAPSNPAADFIAERLQSIPSLNGRFIRLYSHNREDIFNIDISQVKPYTLLYRMLFMNIEEQMMAAMKVTLNDERLEKIKYYIEYYFSDENLVKDRYLNTAIASFNKEGFVDTFFILGFKKMKEFHASIEDVKLIAPFAMNFEISPNGAMIRKR